MNLEELIKERHSAVNYQKEFKMTETDFKNILDMIKLAPSPFNLQSTNYLIITDDAKKDLVYELSYNQHKIHTASAVILVLGNKDAYTIESAETIYAPMKMLKIISPEDYDQLMVQIGGWVGGLAKNKEELLFELHRNCALNVGFFLLSAKHHGFDTCTMHVHNKDKLREEFNIPTNQEIVMMLTVGKSVDKVRPRGYRRPASELAKYNTF